MILHSIVPEERIYEGLEQMAAPEEVEWGGIRMQVERTVGTKARIVRLLHPDPSVYLDDRLTPGTEIDLAGHGGPRAQQR